MSALVLFTTLIGYLMAWPGKPPLAPLMHTMLATALLAGAAGALNQLMEKRIDALMRRTRNRPLPSGRLGPAQALVFGLILALLGLIYLAVAVNTLTAILGMFTLIIYLLFYTPLKKHTSYAIFIGSVSGALPPVMGFTAAYNQIALEAVLLFAILAFWQIPHFWAIAWTYRDDYAAAGLAFVPRPETDQGLTIRRIMIPSSLLFVTTLIPAYIGMAGSLYYAAAVILGLGFLAMGAAASLQKTAGSVKALFASSILYLPLLLIFMALDKIQ